jgi:hypothetical protein
MMPAANAAAGPTTNVTSANPVLLLCFNRNVDVASSTDR